MGSQTSNFSTCMTSSFHTLPKIKIEAKVTEAELNTRVSVETALITVDKLAVQG